MMFVSQLAAISKFTEALMAACTFSILLVCFLQKDLRTMPSSADLSFIVCCGPRQCERLARAERSWCPMHTADGAVPIQSLRITTQFANKQVLSSSEQSLFFFKSFFPPLILQENSCEGLLFPKQPNSSIRSSMNCFFFSSYLTSKNRCDSSLTELLVSVRSLCPTIQGKFGVNLRHLGRVRDRCTQPLPRALLLILMAVRVSKNELNKRLRWSAICSRTKMLKYFFFQRARCKVQAHV